MHRGASWSAGYREVSSEVEVGEGTYSKYQTDRFEDQIDYAADRRYDRSLRCEAGRAG